MRRVGDSRPSVLLAEIDHLWHAFGVEDHHLVPRSRARSSTARLWSIAEAVVAHGTWSLEAVGMWLRGGDLLSASLSPMARSVTEKPGLATHLFVERKGRLADLLVRGESHGYRDRSGGNVPMIAFAKFQPLSLRGANNEARFLEAEVALLRRSHGSKRRAMTRRPRPATR